MKGAYMLLDEASVTGTANILMAAVLAEGVTTIYNAACEPYLQQLSMMLNRMGARISGVGSNLLTIEGVQSLCGTEHTILPDMIEVGSFIGMAAMTGSEITIKNTGYDKLGLSRTLFAAWVLPWSSEAMIFISPGTIPTRSIRLSMVRS